MPASPIKQGGCFVRIDDKIQSYQAVVAQKSQAPVSEESSRIILRLPVDSVFISDQARALHKGQLRVRMDAEGTFAKVTNLSSDPRMKVMEKGMREVKRTLDSIKTLTKKAEDETLSENDRYYMQIKIVELEGDLEKIVYKMQEDYKKLVSGVSDNGTEPLELENDTAALSFSSDLFYVTDRATGKRHSFGKFSGMVDKKTALKVEMINRVRMREQDPEAYAEHIEKYREIYRDDFIKQYESGNWATPFDSEMLATVADIARSGQTGQGFFPENKFADVPVVYESVSIGDTDLRETGGENFVPDPDVDVDWLERLTQQYVDKRIARLEADDYREFNAMRVSVMGPKLAKESGDFIEDLTDQLTKRFEHFTEILQQVERDDAGAFDDEKKSRLIGELFGNIRNFLEETLLHRIQKDTVRGASEEKDERAVKTLREGNAFESGIRS